MRKHVVLTILVLLMNAPVSIADVETTFMQGLGDSHYKRVNSEIVGRPYHIFIMLPDEYEQASIKKYPTIYILDGGGLFPLLTAYYRYLKFGNEVPDVIIIGISYGSDNFERGNYRSTDFTAKSSERKHWGGAEKFQHFLSAELMPYVEKNYRSDSQRRVIFGQSIGGQFVLYTAQTRPELFWGHVASNPALHRNLSFFLEKHTKPNSATKTSKVFVASASNDDPSFLEPRVKWIEHWSDREDRPWHLKVETLDGHSHMSAPPAAFRQGITWLFSTE